MKICFCQEAQWHCENFHILLQKVIGKTLITQSVIVVLWIRPSTVRRQEQGETLQVKRCRGYRYNFQVSLTSSL